MAKGILNVGGYTILKRLGNGARSTIYSAVDDQEDRIVALKRVILEKPEDVRVFEQTETEFKVANKIDHPYVRKCFKLRKVRHLFKVKELLMSMELFEGKTLEEASTLSLGDVLLIFRMVATGLNAMHQKGFVHCDMKPNNILINKSGAIKIIDLGQSCKIGTTKARIQGTPDYIAPEQVQRKELGPKTDIFNLGATMYWALTGKNIPTLIPKTPNSVGMVEKPRDCPNPRSLKKQIPAEVSDLVMKCVKNESAERPRNMMEIISCLDRVIQAIFGDRIKAKKNGAGND
ncbi:MAG: serine/threonine protein kinase [Planctomycetes bacterium]|nr:serine/threonine protein kinase [Planctomycetota bacterium]